MTSRSTSAPARHTPREVLAAIAHPAVLVGSLGYFVDIYDLILFAVVRVSSLKNLGVDYLKIDGSFMRNLDRDSVNQAMVAAMIQLARTLNFKVIGEQIEEPAALEAARSIGIDFLQGYAVGRPTLMRLAA